MSRGARHLLSEAPPGPAAAAPGSVAPVANSDGEVEPDVDEDHPVSDHWVWAGAHRPPWPRALVESMTRGWGASGLDDAEDPRAGAFAARRAALAERLPGLTLVVPSGGYKVRSNDTDFRFRPGSDFFYLTGCDEPDAVLVVGPGAGDAPATLFVAGRSDPSTHAFFSDSRYGELWVGARRGPAEAAARHAIATSPLEALDARLDALAEGEVATVRDVDSSSDDRLKAHDADTRLAEALGEMRLVKDDWEVHQLELAVAATVAGFEDVVRALPQAVGRSERVIEGVFNLRARVDGNDVGYGTIAAAGAHATILHWMRNDGEVRAGDLLLLDAGVEVDSLYTADVTRTLPVSGRFSDAQRRVYDLVFAAQEAGLAAVRPGADFRDPHDAAMAVLAAGLVDLGILDADPAEALRPDRQLHARYTLHGVSHMLGLDVHDCAHARNDLYRGELREGYVLTVEPGLYFQPHDLTVPEEYRGIGVRIEDDVLVTADGCRNLSAALPRASADVEAWMAGIWASGARGLV
jgi:Xaa-Pro aminopeptidase